MRRLSLTALLLLACHAAPLARQPDRQQAAADPGAPNTAGLQLVARLPAELPQRVTGFAYDGEKFWAAIYLGDGRYATLDPSSLRWEVSKDGWRHQAIREVAGAFGSPGAICFVGRRLWVAGSYGESFGSIDAQEWRVERLFKGKQRVDGASQSYASMAYDGSHLWIAWHWFNYSLPASQTQLLLKVDPETGKIVGEYALPAGTRNDVAHGLAWDGARLWHAKDDRLSAIDPSDGEVTAQYALNGIRRPSGLAWDGRALWIAEFGGKIWRLPF